MFQTKLPNCPNRQIDNVNGNFVPCYPHMILEKNHVCLNCEGINCKGSNNHSPKYLLKHAQMGNFPGFLERIFGDFMTGSRCQSGRCESKFCVFGSNVGSNF